MEEKIKKYFFDKYDGSHRYHSNHFYIKMFAKEIAVDFLKWQCKLLKEGKADDLLSLTEEELYDKFLESYES